MPRPRRSTPSRHAVPDSDESDVEVEVLPVDGDEMAEETPIQAEETAAGAAAAAGPSKKGKKPIKPLAVQNNGASAGGSDYNDAAAAAAAAADSGGVNGGGPSQTSSFKRGSVLSVRLHNFLTYADCRFKVGPRLNIVVGPNGTGKSSIVCALALGLGGSPKVLGRSDNLADFVQHEKDDAFVEVQLYDPKGDFTVRREFKRGSNKSTWKFNKKPITEAAIRSKIAAMGVAVDNLCTFLPQDKVGDFSSFAPDKLLIETEKALGGSELHAVHLELIERQEGSKRGVDELAKVEARLEQLTRENELVERDVRRMQDREKQQQRLEVLKKRQLCLNVEAMRAMAKAAKDKYVAAKDAAKQALVSTGPLRKQEEELKREMVRLRSQVDGLKNAGDARKTELANADQQCERFLDEQGTQKAKIENFEKRREAKQKQLATAQQKLADCQSRLKTAVANAQGAEARLAELAPLLDQADAARNAAEDAAVTAKNAEMRAAGAAAQCDRELKTLKNVRAQGLERIRSQGRGREGESALKALQWIEANRERFKGPVHGPVALEVSVEDPAAARCLESHVPNYMWMAFVTEAEEDSKLLTQEFGRGNLSVTLFHIEGGRLRNLDPREAVTPERMALLRQNYGVRGVLEDFMTAPPAVLQVLRDNAAVHSALLGSEASQEKILRGDLLTEISRNTRGARIFVPAAGGGGGGRGGGSSQGGNGGQRWQAYTTTTSSYTGMPSTVVREVAPGSLLARGEDAATIAHAEAGLQQAQAALSQQQDEVRAADQKFRDAVAALQPLEKERRDLLGRQSNASKMRGDLISLQGKVEAATEALERETSQGRDDCVKRLEAALMGHVKAVDAMQLAVRKAMTLEVQRCGASLEYEIARRRHDEAATELQAAGERRGALEQAEMKAKEDFNVKKARFMKIREQANIEAPQFEKDAHGRDTDVETKLWTEMDKLPDVAEEIEALIQECKDVIDKTVFNPQVMRQYEERKKVIAETSARLDELQKHAADAENAMARLLRPWEEKLLSAVEKLDQLFKRYMAEMDCGGGVSLRRPDELENGEPGSYRAWGIEILVRFRDKTEMQVLSSTIHSGGERSVSTVLYLMALQDLQHSPFRVVDEINQGMDPRNERLVFSRIVRNSIGPSRPQYFLITPKLLQGLVAMEHEDVTVLTIFNGPFNLCPKERFDVQSFVRKRRAMNEGGNHQPENKRHMTKKSGSAIARTESATSEQSL